MTDKIYVVVNGLPIRAFLYPEDVDAFLKQGACPSSMEIWELPTATSPGCAKIHPVDRWGLRDS
jgi:hypothetical protein